MFRALTCPSSGGQIVLSQHLVSSHSVQPFTEGEDTRCCSLLSSGILYSRLQRVKIPDAAVCSHPAYCTAVYRECRYQMLQSALIQHTVQPFTESEDTRCCSLLSFGILYSRLQRVAIADAVIMQFVLLKMGMLMLETCRGL